MLKVKDILPDYSLKNIQVRTNDPFGEDMLFGFCHWIDSELISADGDTYSIEEEIYKYEFNENGQLTYWIISEWI